MSLRASPFSASARAFTAFLAVLCLAPVPLGSNRALPLMVVEVGLFAVCIWTFFAWYGKRLALPGGLKPYLILGALWLAFHMFQLMPLPTTWVQALSPATFAAYARTGATSEGAISLTVDRYATLGATLEAAAYLVAFCVAFIWCASLRRMKRLMQVLVALGVAQVIFGWFAELLSDGRFAWIADPPAYLAMEGTYANPNHLAGLLEMSIGAAFGLLMSQRGDAGREGRGRMRSPTILWLALCILVTGLLATASRGGIAAQLIAMGAIGLPSVYRLGLMRLRSRSRKSLVFVLALFLAALLGLGGAMPKLDAKRQDGGRLEFWNASLQLLQRYPLTGSGGGTYEQAMAAYKPAWLGEVRLEHAHNDYLELLAEYGAMGALLLGCFLVLLLGATRHLLRIRDPNVAGCYAGLAIGLVAVLAHGLIDFNFQIPANALWFSALAGTMAAQSARRREAAGQRQFAT